AELAVPGRLLVHVKGLGVELTGVLDDLLRGDLVAAEAMRLTDLDVLEVDEVAHAGVSGRRLSMVTPTMARTVSPFWLTISDRLRTKPIGVVRDGQASRISRLRVSVSPGRTGLSQRQESMPGDPAPAACSRCIAYTEIRIMIAQVCHPL